LKYFLFLFFISVLLSGCSSNKYIGKSATEYGRYSCPLSNKACGGKDKNLEIRYQVIYISEKQYEIKGYAIWNNKGISAIYDNVDDLKMYVLFTNKESIVHEEMFRLKGDFDKKIQFKRKFSTNSSIDASVVTDIMTTLTQ